MDRIRSTPREAGGRATLVSRAFLGPISLHPQGWLLAAAAALGFVVALLLVASVSSTKARRQRRRELRSMKHRQQGEGMETDYASRLDGSYGRRETASDLDAPR